VLAGVRVTTAVEEHGGGRQLVRMRCRPTWSKPALAITLLLLAVAAAAAIDRAAIAATVLALLGAVLGVRTIAEASSALALTARVLRGPSP
jgi:hypothetical protein